MSRGEQNLTSEQVALLERGKAAKEAYKHSLAEIERRLEVFRKEQEQAAEALRIRFTQEVFAIRKGGVPVTRIARDVFGQKGTVATYAAIQEGARYASGTEGGSSIEGAESDRLFRGEDGEIIFIPTGAELEPILAKLSLSPEGAPTEATFRVIKGALTPVTPAMLPSGTMHPVVAMVMADGSKYAHELTAFAA